MTIETPSIYQNIKLLRNCPEDLPFPDLIPPFGWEKVTIKQAAAVLSAIDPVIPFTTYRTNLQQKVTANYPEFIPSTDSIQRTLFPTLFLLEDLNKLVPSEEISAIATAIHQLGITPMEYATGLLLIRGFSHPEIAQFFKNSLKTIEKHTDNLYKKAGDPPVCCLFELTQMFLHHHLIPSSILPQLSPSLNLSELTPREREVFSLIPLTNKGIANELGIREKTVEKHMGKITEIAGAGKYSLAISSCIQEKTTTI